MKKRASLLFSFILILVFLMSCNKASSKGEGDCILNVGFETIPSQFSLLNEAVLNRIRIRIWLKNITTEKRYRFELTKKTDFSTELRLPPGVYQVEFCYSEVPELTGLNVSARQEKLELTKEKDSQLIVDVSNPKEFAQLIQNLQATDEILEQERFSGIVQWNGTLIDLHDILKEKGFSWEIEENKLVPPYQKMDISDKKAGVLVTVINEDSKARSWKQCQVIAVQFQKNRVVFGKGVTMGMPMKAICHAKTGVYGTPDQLEGAVFRGLGLDKTYVIYRDLESGDQLTLTYSSEDDYMLAIQYEFALFEQ